jgi:hypothetical protein
VASTPHEASEIERFTPASLADIENPPIFRLRAASRRERRRYDSLLIEEGLRRHDQEAMRAEILRGLRALSSDDEFEIWEPNLKQHWDAVDDWAKENATKSEDDREHFEAPGPSEDEISTVTRGIHENWRPLRKMAAENVAFSRDAPALMLGVVISGWSNLDTPFSSREGILSLDTIDGVDTALAKLERDLGKPEGIAFVELYVACTNRLFLSKEVEKNFSSPPPSLTNPQSSTTGTASEAGTSKASAISTETPAN